MRHDGLKTCLFLLSLLLGGAALPASAQNSTLPPVEVDMSVLNALQPAAGQHNEYSQPVRPMLTRTNKGKTQKPEPAAAPQNANYYWPVDEAPPQAKIISYPITVRERTELIDPSLEKATYTGKPKHEKEELQLNPPLPDFKPVASAAKATAAPAPLPPRRPASEKASLRSAPELKREYATKLVKGKATMPAVPALQVESEPLKVAKTPEMPTDDLLAANLINPDKDTMVKSIAAITASLQEIDESFEPKKAPLPPEKPVIAKASRITDVSDLTAIEPAAGAEAPKTLAMAIDITEPTGMTAVVEIPRTPPKVDTIKYEQEYISLPFPQSAAALDETTAETLAQDILPLLKSNPEWRVQIQAFASEQEDALKGARRMSLSRALSIRSYLMEQGVEAQRMDVRALGMQTDRKPADRVDFVFFDPNITQ